MSAEQTPTDYDAFGKKSSSQGLVRKILKDLAVMGRQRNLKSFF